MNRLKDKYQKEVIPQMEEKFDYKNVMAVPRIEKVVVNTGFGSKLPQMQEGIVEALTLICGQRAVLTRAKKAISGFKIRRDMPIGARVTLRGRKMYDFLERVIYLVLPRSRDFWGIDPKSIDKHGNLTIAIKEHIAFPEISTERAKDIFGLEITVVTTAKTREEGLELLKLLGFPIK